MVFRENSRLFSAATERLSLMLIRCLRANTQPIAVSAGDFENDIPLFLQLVCQAITNDDLQLECTAGR